MSEDRIHRTVFADGTSIAGRVVGDGPPLVLVHGGVSDGEAAWRTLLPHLAGRFTCFAMSLRGRGLSGDDPDHAPERLQQDVVAFADSIDEPVGLVGHSSGGAFAIGAAAEASRVTAVAAYEPALPELAGAAMLARWRDAYDRSRRFAAGGMFADAARALIEGVALANDDELVAVAESGAAELLARNVPAHLLEADAYFTYRVLEPGRLERLTMPVAVLHGERSHGAYRDIAAELVTRLATAESVEVPGAGHLGPQISPGPVTGALTAFLSANTAPVPVTS